MYCYVTYSLKSFDGLRAKPVVTNNADKINDCSQIVASVTGNSFYGLTYAQHPHTDLLYCKNGGIFQFEF